MAVAHRITWRGPERCLGKHARARLVSKATDSIRARATDAAGKLETGVHEKAPLPGCRRSGSVHSVLRCDARAPATHGVGREGWLHRTPDTYVYFSFSDINIYIYLFIYFIAPPSGLMFCFAQRGRSIPSHHLIETCRVHVFALSGRDLSKSCVWSVGLMVPVLFLFNFFSSYLFSYS